MTHDIMKDFVIVIECLILAAWAALTSSCWVCDMTCGEAQTWQEWTRCHISNMLALSVHFEQCDRRWTSISFKLSVYAFVGKAIADLKCIATVWSFYWAVVDWCTDWVPLLGITFYNSQIIPKIVLHPTMYNHTLTEKPLTDLTVIMED